MNAKKRHAMFYEQAFSVFRYSVVVVRFSVRAVSPPFLPVAVVPFSLFVRRYIAAAILGIVGVCAVPLQLSILVRRFTVCPEYSGFPEHRLTRVKMMLS